MRITNVLPLFAGATLAVFALPSFAAGPGTCAASQPIAASHTQNFEKEANTIMQSVQGDAEQARDQAATLQRFTDDHSLDWHSHSVYLAHLREAVNDMGTKVCSLETIRGAVAPWQQAAIDKMQAEVQLMALHTQQAIEFGNTNQANLWASGYRSHLDNIYQQARALTRTLSDAVNYAHVQKQYRNLKQDLGTHAGS